MTTLSILRTFNDDDDDVVAALDRLREAGLDLKVQVSRTEAARESGVPFPIAFLQGESRLSRVTEYGHKPVIDLIEDLIAGRAAVS